MYGGPPVTARSSRRRSPHGHVLLPDLAQHRATRDAGARDPSTDRVRPELSLAVLYPRHQAILGHRAGAPRRLDVGCDREPARLFTWSFIVVSSG